MFALPLLFGAYFVHLVTAFHLSGGLFGYVFGFQKICLCRCGIAHRFLPEYSRTGRLLGGEGISPHQFPWLAVVTIGSQTVGGSLISDRLIVSAASPFYGKAPNEISVSLGAHDRCGNGSDPVLNVSVSAVHIHPGFSPTNKHNDIALLRLRHVVPFSQFISPICMPQYVLPESGQVAWTAAWNGISGNASCTPRVVTMPILIMFRTLQNSLIVKTEDVFKKIQDDEEYADISKCSCRCGERNEASRILGGVETKVNEFPWVVRLTYFKRFYCGGILINDRYVLTAAHCVKGLMWFMIKVTLGEHNRCNETVRPETRFVTRVVAHNFTYSTFRNDLALLRLNQPVNITDTVKPICLPHSDDNTYVGVKAIAAGWGSVSEEKNHSCVLNDVELPIISNEVCRKSKYEPSMIADDMLCAGYPDKGEKDTCQGDSGGPLAAERGDKRYELLGIVSWGIGCGRAGYPGVYTRVTKYLYWIRHNARKGCFCSD